MAQKRISRRQIWLNYYLDQYNKTTFMNATASAEAAGYMCRPDQYGKVGSQNLKACEKEISVWLQQSGLSDNVLRGKLVSLLDAEETKFFAHKGQVVDEKNVADHGIQIRALDMAFKLSGAYAPEKTEVNMSGHVMMTTARITSETPLDEAARIYSKIVRGGD